ncbi:MAG: hypothetical protein IT237_00545 [Bacteroidia bacterium]|nr:hypothetical protein [Bacteroidia bacterium]
MILKKMINTKYINLLAIYTIAIGSVVESIFNIGIVLWIGIIIGIYSAYLGYTHKSNN